MTATYVPLGNYLEGGNVSYGIVQPGSDAAEGVPIVRAGDIRGGTIVTSSPLRVEADVSARHARTVLQGGELLFSVVGSVGETALVPLNIAGWNVARAVAVLRTAGVNSRWLHYFLGSPDARQQVSALLNTTVQPTLNLADLKRISVPVMSPPEQQAIAEVLGALDDKIAANTALAATNTALASAEFAAASRDVTRELTFDDVASVSGGGTPSTKITEFWDGNICWATPTDMTALVGPYLESSSRMITRDGLEACSSKLFAPGAVLMTSRATIGALAINTVPTAVNQGFIVVEPRDPLMKWWLFHEMESRVDEFVSWANGATFLELSRGNFKRLQVRVPPGELLAKFVATATALHDAARALLAENRTLAATRDALLPQLMSGKLRVRDAEAAVSDAGV